MTTLLKKAARSVLIPLGFSSRTGAEVRPNPIHQWRDDRRFVEIMQSVEGFTLVDVVRCFMLYQFARHVAHVPGDFAEVGVYKGGTARLLAETIGDSNKTIHLFDTFAGMPTADPVKDRHREGDFSDTSVNDVKSYLGKFPNVRYYQGVFPGTAGSVSGETFSLVHVDADIYRSVKDCLQFFYPRMASGGILVCDDYGFLTCPGAKEAVDEFFGDKAEIPLYLSTGQCFIIKLHGPATSSPGDEETIP